MKTNQLKKGFKILLTAGLLLYIGFQTYFIMAQTPKQPYQLIEKRGEMEIRFYPSAVEASVQKTGEYRQMMNDGFRDLAGYIFGGNQEGQKIAMTAPVKSVVEDEKKGVVTFIMPENFQIDNKPTPLSSKIQFTQTAPVYTASYTFGGFASKAKMDKQAQKLLQEIQAQGFTPKGKVAYLYYNPPFQLLFRRNEVLVEIEGFQKR